MTAAGQPLERLFAPRSIALVGVSRDPQNLGQRYLRHLLRHGFPAQALSIVNPTPGEIAGIPITTSVGELETVPDLAIVLTGGSVTLELLRQLAERGVAAANIFSDSPALLAEASGIRDVLQESGMRLLGPNSAGFVCTDPPIAANASAFLGRTEALRFAPVSVISQSGAIAGILADKLLAAGAGFDLLIGTGNELDLTAGESLAHAIARDPVPNAVGMFLEALRPQDPLLDALESASTAGVRIFVLKAGRTEAGRRAGAAHSGDADAWDGATERALLAAGGALCRDVEELATALLVSTLPRPAGNRIATCCTSGGLSGVFADLVSETGFEVAALPSPTNPWDTGPEVIHHPERVAERFHEYLALPGVDCGMLAISTMPDSVIERLFETLASRPSDKPYLVMPVAAVDPAAAAAFAGSGGAVVSQPAGALKALHWAVERRAVLRA